ncbi:sensor histidine kinase [Phycicoccus flavus]|uniref:histidine kinase n=1 Tax=Phycicoccus flavus TaxID=2502783 RepID=A0A8T6R440_9MICO|nr:histidine kinase [Phycicoccus flavus]NHA67001.1 hypothetical protein [Phycicoccus flavus]
MPSLRDLVSGPRPPRRAPTRRSDAVIALSLFAVGLTILSSGIGPFAEIPALVPATTPMWHLVPLAVGCAGVTVQSRTPVVAFVLATVALVADVVIGLHMAVLGVWVNAVYAAGRHLSLSARGAVRWVVGLVCAAVAAWVLASGRGAGDAVLGTLQVGVFAALALWLSGDARSGDDRAERERRRSADERRRAVAEQAEVLQHERARLAAQFHDTISSNLSSIALFTTAALDRDPDTDRDRSVLHEARRAALDGLTDMRALIDVLRSYDVDVDDARDVEQPSLEEIVAGLEPAGLEVDADLATVELGPAQEQALAQVVKESLTNALKHGDGRATVRLVSTGTGVRLTVSNGLAACADGDRRPPVIAGGIGLGSMAARVSAVGGRFRSGETETGQERRWSVDAEIPRVPSRDGGPR